MTYKELETLKNKVERMIEDLEQEQEELQDRMDAIEERASNRDSGELTESEDLRMEKLQDEYDAIETLKDTLYEAISNIDDLMVIR